MKLSRFLLSNANKTSNNSDSELRTLEVYISLKRKLRRKVYLYQKGDFESMRKDTSDFAKDRYFNEYSDNRSVQENFDLITSFIQEAAAKHIPSKTSRSVGR